MLKIPVEISARHIHISKDDLEFLFGDNFNLSKERDLSQKGEFVSKERINLVNRDKKIENVRILGPLRDETQIEISKTDTYFLNIEVPLKISGQLEGSAGITLEGPVGRKDLKNGVIIAKRHLHCNPTDAEELNIKDGDLISIKVEGERSLVFNEVVVRVGEESSLMMHIDTDEGNAAGINGKGFGELII